VSPRDDIDGIARSGLGALLPHGWVFQEQLSLLHPGGQANVIFSSQPSHDVGATGVSLANEQGEALQREFPGYREHSVEEFEFGPNSAPAILRRFDWSPEDGPPVTQLQVYAAANGRVYTATATATIEKFGEFEALFGRVLESLTGEG
jgi:hypothetical protein